MRFDSRGSGRFIVYRQSDTTLEHPGEVRISGNARQRRAIVRRLTRMGYYLMPGGVAR